jgi:ABC-type sugar transport system substrate-binding protein
MRHLKAGLVGLLISAAVSGVVLADGIKGAPPPFDKGGVKIALVSYLSQGDYFEAYEAGVARQAKTLGVDLHISRVSRTLRCSASRSSRRLRSACRASS